MQYKNPRQISAAYAHHHLCKNITKFLITYLYRNDRFQHGYCINIWKKCLHCCTFALIMVRLLNCGKWSMVVMVCFLSICVSLLLHQVSFSIKKIPESHLIEHFFYKYSKVYLNLIQTHAVNSYFRLTYLNMLRVYS